MLSRDFEDRAKGEKRDHRWWGPRMTGLMLLSLHLYGEITIVGRRGGERLWDLTSRWWPETETMSIRESESYAEERRFRTQGVRLVKGEWDAHPDAEDGPVPDRAVLLSPFDRLVHRSLLLPAVRQTEPPHPNTNGRSARTAVPEVGSRQPIKTCTLVGF